MAVKSFGRGQVLGDVTYGLQSLPADHLYRRSLDEMSN